MQHLRALKGTAVSHAASRMQDMCADLICCAPVCIQGHAFVARGWCIILPTLTPYYPSLLNPRPCSLPIPAHSPSLLSQPLHALHTPFHCLHYHTLKCVTNILWLPILILQIGKHQQPASHTASVKVGVTRIARSAEAYKLQASSQAGIATPAVLPTSPAPAHHNKLITASAPEAEVSAEGQSLGLADAARMQAAVSYPLRQKSSLLLGRGTEDDDAQAAARDVIPSLPRVTYSDRGTARVAT